MQANHSIRLARTGLVAFLTIFAAAQEQEPQQSPPASGQESGVDSSTQSDPNTRLTLRLRDRALTDVVQSIRRRAGVNIIVDVGDEDLRVTIDLEDVEWRRALELVAEAAGCVVVEVAGNVLKVEKPPAVTFAFENADVQKVIDTIAKVSGANIVVAPEVQGTITLRLRNIPWRDALEATAKTLGYAVVEENRGILRIVPPANMVLDTITREFQLRYVRPRSAYLPYVTSEYVERLREQNQQGPPPFTLIEALNEVLTPDVGRLRHFEEQNLIIVTDTKTKVDEIERIIRTIDVEPGQVFIDVMFVTTTNTDVLDYGINIGENGWSASMNLGQIPHKLPFDLGAGGWDDNLIADDRGIGPFGGQLNSNDPAGTTIPDVVFGALNFTEVSATLRLLKRDVEAEIVQAPKLIALDHQEATIFVGETIRYAQARAEQGQAGGLTLVVEEAPNSPVSSGFQLLVIPHIVPGTDKVMMDIIPKSDALAGTGSSALAPEGFDVFRVGAGTAGGEGSIALPRVSSSTIATKVLLRSDQTAVLGGLVQNTDTVTEVGLPLLGDIPVLGYLFKNKASTKSKRTLIVFVTPRIIRSPEDVDDNIRRILEERRKLMQKEWEAVFGKRS